MSSQATTTVPFRNASTTSTTAIGAYRVFPFPLEGPSFGASVLVPDPSDPLASPFGWHDDNGVTGAEYTITRGNNVYAYDDIANQDAPGSSPDGTSLLNFDFPANLSQPASTYTDASNVNLFYVNNMVHDYLYHYGFDEVSGNFQEFNYSGSGAGNDYVVAEAQDGGGTNNANFSTPDDGQNGRMQMYLWSGVAQSTLVIK
ncbi:MAG: M36 family metallopeptidase [Bacteroidetes bacterium]|nr:M36 family metallopeptidase [Bacteroidota bacterium]